MVSDVKITKEALATLIAAEESIANAQALMHIEIIAARNEKPCTCEESLKSLADFMHMLHQERRRGV